MARHVSSPGMLNWWQRLAIATPVLLLAGMAVVSFGPGDDGDGDRVASTTEVADVPEPPSHRPVSDGTPGSTGNATPGDDPGHNSDGPERTPESDGNRNEPRPRDGARPDEPERAPEDGTGPEDDAPPRDDESTPDDEPTPEDESTPRDEPGDRPSENPHEHSPEDSDGDPAPDDNDENEEPDDDSDRDVVTPGQAQNLCRDAITDRFGSDPPTAVRQCVDSLAGTPTAHVEATLDDTVSGLTGTVRSTVCASVLLASLAPPGLCPT